MSFASSGLPSDKLSSFGSDSANVMVGWNQEYIKPYDLDKLTKLLKLL